jgi:hypothetical protein
MSDTAPGHKEEGGVAAQQELDSKISELLTTKLMKAAKLDNQAAFSGALSQLIEREVRKALKRQ